MSIHPPRIHTREEVLAATSRPVPASIKTLMLVLSAVGVIAFVAGLFVAPARTWYAFHANWLFFATLSAAGVVFVGAQRITTARWSRHVIRFMEGYVAFLPIAFVLLVITFVAGRGYVFPWTHEPYPVPEKAIYYNGTFLITRDLVIFGLVTLIGIWFIYRSVRLDVALLPEVPGGWADGIRRRMRANFGEERREIHSAHSLWGKLGVVLVLLFGMGFSVLAWDLSMGLSLHFQSTLYSWWFFMGGWLCALSLFGLIVMAWDRFLGGAAGMITDIHYHDIGKLVFAFTAFWGYLTFGQYLVIWYGNMGEETFFMRVRLIQPWVGLTVASTLLVFVVPFFGLLSRAAKVFKPTFFLFSLASLVGMWIMRYIEVYPSELGTTVASAPFGIWEIGVTLLYVGLWGWSYLAFMDAFPRMRSTLITSAFRDEIQVPVNPETMEPIPAHE